MKRIFEYRNFAILVELEPIQEHADRTLRRRSVGFIAEVRIFRAGVKGAADDPLYLPANRSVPFPTEVEALAARFSTGQQLIDGTLSREQTPRTGLH